MTIAWTPDPKKNCSVNLHIVTHLCQFMAQNSKVTSPKMVSPYSLGTCPPKTPTHFEAFLLLH